MADTNPANFANLPKEKVQEIASKGGKASHGATGDAHADELAKAGRNPDGTFIAGGAAAKEAGHHSHDNDEGKEAEDNGRRADGTFTKGSLFTQCLLLHRTDVVTLRIGSEAAKEAGHIGGLQAHGKEDGDDKKESGRREDGTFVPGSEAAKEGMSYHSSLLQPVPSLTLSSGPQGWSRSRGQQLSLRMMTNKIMKRWFTCIAVDMSGMRRGYERR